MAFCSNCGAKLNDGVKFCSECGSAVNVPSAAMQQTNSNTEPVKHKGGVLGDLSGVLAAGIRTVTDKANQAMSSVQDGRVQNAQIPSTPSMAAQSSASKKTTRQQEYAGIVLKCPNCGSPIGETTAICPDCGFKITGRAAVSSVQVFSEQLMAIEAGRRKDGLTAMLGVGVNPADQKKLSLVRSFPIPNTVDDILEFMLLAVTNIDVGLSKNTMMNRYQGGAKSGESSLTMPKTISDAWVAKMKQAYQKAEVAFPNDPAFSSIQKIYYDKMKELKIKI